MEALTLIVQLLCVSLDVWLLVRLRGMTQGYIGFSLARSITRMCAYWLYPVQTWALVYWWGELLGYLVLVLLVASLTKELVPNHLNTRWFYTMASLLLIGWLVFTLKLPLTFAELTATKQAAFLLIGFLLLVALVLTKEWPRRATLLTLGVALNLGIQFLGGWLEVKWGPVWWVSLVHQSGFVTLQLFWLTATRPLESAEPSA